MELELAKLVDLYQGAAAACCEEVRYGVGGYPAEVGGECRGGDVKSRLRATERSDNDIEAKPPSAGTIFADFNSLPYPILDSLARKGGSCLGVIGTMSRSVGKGIPCQLTITFDISLSSSCSSP